MDSVQAEVHRPTRTYKIVKTDSPLRRKIEDGCPAWYPLGYLNIGRKLVSRVNHSPCRLDPWHKTMRRRSKIPAKDYRGDAYPCECAAPNVLKIGHTARGYHLRVRRWGIRLPERHDVCVQFKISAERSGKDLRSNRPSNLKSRRKKVVAGSVAQSFADIDKRAKLPFSARRGIHCSRYGVRSSRTLSGKRSRYTGGKDQAKKK